MNKDKKTDEEEILLPPYAGLRRVYTYQPYTCLLYTSTFLCNFYFIHLILSYFILLYSICQDLVAFNGIF